MTPALPSVSTPGAAGSQAAGQSSPGDNSAGVDRVRFVQRVANAFQTMGDDGGTLRLRLSPPDLGSLKLEVSVRDGVMSARIEADTPQARDLLVDNLPALRERLSDQNIKMDKFDVDLSGQSSGGLPQRSAQDAEYQRSAAAPSRQPAGTAGAAGTSSAPAGAATAQIIASDQLNVVI